MAGTPVGAADRVLTDVRGLSIREATALLTERIESGQLVPGDQLPTIRAFAAASGLGTSSVASIWSLLVDRGLVRTRRRGGTVVVGPRAGWARAGDPQPFAGWSTVDLSSAHPSADHLPDLMEAFARSLREPDTNALQREFITDLLLRAVEADWPFTAQEWVTVSGAGEAILLAAEAATEAGGTIAVQDPTTTGMIGNFRSLGFTVLGVESDEHGPTPDSLALALRAGARTFVYQPTGSFTIHSRTTPERLAELASVVRAQAPGTRVLEEDVLGPLAPGAPLTMAELLPGQVVRVASYCRAFGLDLRTTVIGGSREIVDRIRRLRSHGILAQSRILQNALAHLLLDPDARTLVAEAARGYAQRRDALVAALQARGVEATSPPGGFLVWVPAENEEEAIAELAVRGVVLSSSTRNFAAHLARPPLRIATPQLPTDPDLITELARMLADASRGALLAG